MADEMNKCVEYIEEKLFKTSGECADEVILTFDDGQRLYVSESLLCYSSPVFKAMFKHDFKEKETREILMTRKCFEDVHELLLCLHPAVQKPINNGNVLRVVALADEYQVKLIINRCKAIMKKWMLSELEKVKKQIVDNDRLQNTCHYSAASICLKILKKADACSYEEIVNYAIKILGKFGYHIFTGLEDWSSESKTVKVVPASNNPSGFSFGSTATAVSVVGGFQSSHNAASHNAAVSKQIIVSKTDCFALFNSLTDHMKNRLMLERLRACDDGSLHE